MVLNVDSCSHCYHGQLAVCMHKVYVFWPIKLTSWPLVQRKTVTWVWHLCTLVAVPPQRHWFLRRTGSRRWHCRPLGTEVFTENNWDQTQDGPGLESRASPCMALALFFLPLLCCWKTETQQRVEKVSLEMSSRSSTVVLRLKKQETLLMSNVCDILQSYEISMISLLFTFIVDESIFY